MSAQTEEGRAVELEVERVVAAARDALSDEMISRLSGTAGDAVELMDQVTRSGLGKAIPALAQMVHNGDLERLSQLARVYASAQDSLSDEMIGRLSEAAGEGLALLDQVNRSGLDRAIPALARMVRDGDLDRISQLARVYASAQDSLSDEMISRLSEAVGEGLSLLDQVNRAGLDRAIAPIAEMVHNGDLQRLVRLARVYGSAEDALSDEMIGRLTETIGTGLSLLDRFNRGGAERVVDMLEDLEATGALERLANTAPQLADRLGVVTDLLHSIEHAVEASRTVAPSPGGVSGLWQMMRDPETQDTLRFLLSVGKQLRKGLIP